MFLIIVGYYHGGCIQTKKYEVKLTAEEKAEIAEMAAKKAVELQEKAEK